MRKLAIVFLRLVSFGPSTAAAAGFEVNPIRLETSAETRSTLLTVRNNSEDPIRLQASASRWEQGEDGSMRLSPTEDVSYFPSLLSLNPGETRNIRVGVRPNSAPNERSYRIVVEQLPPLNKPRTQGIQVLTRMSIPLFVRPAQATIRGAVERLALHRGQLQVDVRNSGTVRYVVKSVRLRGRDASGKVVHEQTLPGWYVLAGGLRSFQVPIPKDRCVVLRAVEAHVDADTTQFSSQTPIKPEDCRSDRG